MTDPLASPDAAASHPPPGWYDDGSGRQRWWTGRDWSDHFQDGLGPVGPLPLSTRCPTCGSLDRVQMVGILLQEGTSHSTTSGVAFTSGISSSPFGTGMRVGSSVSSIRATTTGSSALAQRLSPPPRPRAPVRQWVLWYTLGGEVVALIYGANLSGSLIGAVLTGIFLLLPIVLSAWALAGITALVTQPHYRRLQAVWDQKAAPYYRHLYCLRDDTMFIAGSPAQRPEEVKARAFWG